MEDWIAFIAKRTEDEEFLRISEENRQRALDPDHPFRGGVKGYVGIEGDMLLEVGGDPEVDSIERHILWMEGCKNEEGVIDHPPTREVAERIETLTQAVSQGEMTDCGGREDILAQALPAREYYGRYRGVGFGVTQKTIFGSRKRAKQETTELRRMGNNMCNLYLSTLTYRLVARGTVYNESGGTLHNLPILAGHVKVVVEFAVEGDAPLPVPLVNAYVMTVEQAIGTYVAWPSHLIVLPAKSKVKDKGKVSEHRASKNVGKPRPSLRPPIVGKEQTKGSVASPLKNKSKPQPFQPPITHGSADFITFLRVHVLTRMTDRGNIAIPMEPEILGYEHTLELDGKGAEIGEILNHEWLSQTVISAYLRYLYHEILIPEGRTQRGHWVLFVINPKEDTVYYLDPLHMHFNNHKKMRDTYNQALLIHRGLNGGKSRISKSFRMTKWISIMCPRQPNDNDCGYYVF